MIEGIIYGFIGGFVICIATAFIFYRKGYSAAEKDLEIKGSKDGLDFIKKSKEIKKDVKSKDIDPLDDDLERFIVR